MQCTRVLFLLACLTSGAAMASDDKAGPLDAVKAAIETGSLPGVHGVIVQHRGKRLAEWYFPGHDYTIPTDLGHVDFKPDMLHDVRSVTKSVVSLLFGIALEDGIVKHTEAAVTRFFPEYTDLPAATTRDVKLRHVLSMTSGWNWDEFTWPYSDPRNSEIAMELSQDPIRHVLTQPRVAAPGERFIYSGGDVALIGAIIAKAAGMPLDRYAEERLFKPLGIAAHGWSKREEVPRAASGLRLTPRDMLKIGELVLGQGAIDGRPIVPAAWIDLSTTQKISIPGGRGPADAYGYFWWLGETSSERWIGALGNGGQRIWILPSLDLVVVTAMGLYDSPEQGRVPLAILEAAIAQVR